MDTELFGPVLSVLRFSSEDEAIARANDTKYGLAWRHLFPRYGARAQGLKGDPGRASSGSTPTAWSRPSPRSAAFKDSGYGREGGLQAVYDYTRSKTVWINTSSEPVADPFVMR